MVEKYCKVTLYLMFWYWTKKRQVSDFGEIIIKNFQNLGYRLFNFHMIRNSRLFSYLGFLNKIFLVKKAFDICCIC